MADRFDSRSSLGKTLAAPAIYPGADLVRDLSLAAGPNGLDLKWLFEQDCLNQDLTIALTTAKGSDPFNTDFGFDGINAIAEETEAVMVRERVRVSVISLLQRDPRIKTILDIQLYDSRLQTGADLGAIGQPLGGSLPNPRELQVAVSFETAASQQLVLTLGGRSSSG